MKTLWIPSAAPALAASLLVVAALPAQAKVQDMSPNGFTLAHTLTVQATPAQAYQAFAKVASWWNPEHTYTGKSASLTLDPKPSGCFCEKLGANAGVVHMTVVYADPGKVLRLSGGLGPLQQLGVAGAMTLKFTAKDGATEVAFTYAVGGYTADGLDKLAPIVDQVLGDQLERYERFASGAKP